MNVNDVVCVGAEPIALLDYLAVEQANPEVMEQIGIGLKRGAEQAGVEIPGGEVAILPELIKGHPSPNGFDLTATCFGTVALDQMITGETIAPGDALIGLPSSGLHSNSYSLARRATQDLPLDGPFGDGTLADALLAPTVIYVRAALELIRRDIDVHGLAHITGGGLLNLLRLNEDVGFAIEDPLPVPPIIDLVRERGQVSDAEAWEVFNMGCGFVAVVPEAARRRGDRPARRASPRHPPDRHRHGRGRPRERPRHRRDRRGPQRRSSRSRRARAAGARTSTPAHPSRPARRDRPACAPSPRARRRSLRRACSERCSSSSACCSYSVIGEGLPVFALPDCARSASFSRRYSCLSARRSWVRSSVGRSASSACLRSLELALDLLDLELLRLGIRHTALRYRDGELSAPQDRGPRSLSRVARLPSRAPAGGPRAGRRRARGRLPDRPRPAAPGLPEDHRQAQGRGREDRALPARRGRSDPQLRRPLGAGPEGGRQPRHGSGAGRVHAPHRVSGARPRDRLVVLRDAAVPAVRRGAARRLRARRTRTPTARWRTSTATSTPTCTAGCSKGHGS